jgi:Mitochondrial carrier protein
MSDHGIAVSNTTPRISRKGMFAQSNGKHLTIVAFQFSAGFLSGLSTSVLLQPADLLKTRVQQSPASTNLSTTIRSILSAGNASNKPSFFALYRGTLPSALRTSIGSALYFSGVTNIRSFLQNSQNVLSQNATNLLSGAVARALAGLVIMPITVLKVRFESSLYTYPSLRAAAAGVYVERGWRGFFAGFGATAVRDAPYAGLYVLFYESFKTRAKTFLNIQINDASKSAGVNFASGIVAAGLATAITNPFDAVKTRIQLQPDQYVNSIQAFRRMMAEEGWKSMFRGLGLRMARKGVSSALAWTVYEELIRRWETKLVGSSKGI